MEKEYKFKIGQLVKIKGETDHKMINGVVTDVTRDKVFIKWDDFKEPISHEEWEYYTIKLR